MDGVKEYILRLCCAALIAGAVSALGGRGTGAKLRKMICGLFVLFAAISPLRQIQLDDIWSLPVELQTSAQAAAAQGAEQSDQAIRDIIIEQTGAYILDEAASMDADIRIGQVTLDDETMAPVSVELYGTLSPYDKSVLSAFISEQLGIGKEGQIWKN